MVKALSMLAVVLEEVEVSLVNDHLIATVSSWGAGSTTGPIPPWTRYRVLFL